MPNKKISELQQAQPLTGNEIIPLVQNGVTVRDTLLSVLGLVPTTLWGSIGGVVTDQIDLINYLSTNYQPLDANLTSLSGLTYSSSSFVKMTGAGTFSLDTNVYLTTISGLNISLLNNDSGYITSSALTPYLTSASAAATYVPLSRDITINGVTQDLSANRSWTITAGVDGTGTTNYVSKWQDSDTLTNSIIFDNGTNVGISEATPTARLHIKGSTSDSSAFAFKADNSTPSTLFSVRNNGEVSSLNGYWIAGTRVMWSNDLTSNANFFAGSLTGNSSIQASSFYNIGYGYQCLPNVTTGNRNTAVGSRVLAAITTGGNNIGIGDFVLTNINSSSFNIALGILSGQALQNGSNYTISIGGNIRSSSTINLTESIAIGHGAENSKNNECLIGGTDTTIKFVYLGRGYVSSNLSFGSVTLQPTSAAFTGNTVGASPLTDTGGVEFTIAGSQSTGTGDGGHILFKTSPAGSSGSTQNALVECFRFNGDGAAIYKNFTATQASALTASDGMFIYVSSTNGTFTSVGFWGYENGAWVKL
jgi:hypothetical protein